MRKDIYQRTAHNRDKNGNFKKRMKFEKMLLLLVVVGELKMKTPEEIMMNGKQII